MLKILVNKSGDLAYACMQTINLCSLTGGQSEFGQILAGHDIHLESKTVAMNNETLLLARLHVNFIALIRCHDTTAAASVLETLR